jgi:Flp pilus assembly protein TadG
MASSAAPTAYVRDMFRRFGRDRHGSTAVEFALVAPAFFALLFAIIETAIVFFASQALETLAQDAARQVMTGQAQAAGFSAASQLRNAAICNDSASTVFFSCTNIFIDVESDPTSFANINITNPVTAGAFDPSKLNFSLGGSCSVVTVTLYYQWQLFVTGLGYNISNLSGNKRLLSATAAFRNEPYNGACAS